jgi:hypothetical protein
MISADRTAAREKELFVLIMPTPLISVRKKR